MQEAKPFVPSTSGRDDPVNQAALKALIREAVRVNKSKVSKR